MGAGNVMVATPATVRACVRPAALISVVKDWPGPRTAFGAVACTRGVGARAARAAEIGPSGASAPAQNAALTTMVAAKRAIFSTFPSTRSRQRVDRIHSLAHDYED